MQPDYWVDWWQSSNYLGSLASILSSSSEGDDYDFGHELASPVARKLSYMMEEEMQVVAPETELPSGRP